MQSPLRPLVDRTRSLWPRRARRQRTRPPEPAWLPTAGAVVDPNDDYHVEGHEERLGPGPALRIVQGVQLALIVLMAVLSFAIFWLLGMLLGIF